MTEANTIEPRIEFLWATNRWSPNRNAQNHGIEFGMIDSLNTDPNELFASRRRKIMIGLEDSNGLGQTNRRQIKTEMPTE